jgi:citrate lyase subunit beta/citryl-CoA lyase
VSKSLLNIRSALYVPASNRRALEKARALDADMLIIDLEDSVPVQSKDMARDSAIAETRAGFPGKLLALRVNSIDSPFINDDLAALSKAHFDFLVIPKVDTVEHIPPAPVPVLAMIETAQGLYAARAIAADERVAGLIVGANDICAEMGIRPGPNREGLELALQSVVLAAAAGGIVAFDAVCNQLDDMTGFDAECRQGRCYGFSGKTLIHPNQIAIANAAFGPTDEELVDARALIAAASGGAQRFKGRMIENMHVDDAHRILQKSRIGCTGQQ